MFANAMVDTTKRFPAWQIGKRLRRAGSNQYDIAARCHCSQQMVSNVINRRVPADGELAKRIWAALDDAILGDKRAIGVA